MIVLDQKEDTREISGPILSWQSYADRPNVTSVPRYLEIHAERLRAKYIAFAHDLGESRIAGKRVVDHLDVGGGFSFWWMTRVHEKSPFKSPRVFDCLRVMALEEILIERKPSNLTLDSPDRKLAQAIRRLCQNLKIRFVWRTRAQPKQGWSVRRLYSSLPNTVQGLISLRHIVMRLPFRKLQKLRWFSGDGAIFICSAFFNVDWTACATGRFYARQWEALPNFLQRQGKQINWLHQYLPDPGMPNIKTTLGWARQFNRDAQNQGYHAFLETYLSWKVVGRALRNWFSLNVVAWRLTSVGSAFKPEGSAAWLWPLLRNDWRNSLCGTAAVSNCLWVELFDAALSDIPHQKFGLYIWANQAWECALLRAWRRNGHGEIIGVPHSTTPFWFLDLYDDPRTLTSSQSCAKLLPNRLAINGRMAWKALTDMGYPIERLVAVEALRFQYLSSLGSSRSEKPNFYRASAKFTDGRMPLNILILGDFMRSQTLKMLNCMEAASCLIDSEICLTLKPHPVCEIGTGDFPSLHFELTRRPLVEIVGDFDFAFCGNSTSAGLDALLAGLSVAIFLDDEDFNHSPLRGIPNVGFVSNAEELAAALQTGKRNDFPPPVEEFFWLDNQLPNWRRLLSEVGTNR